MKTLERHLWYLSDLTIPMALFSEKVDPDIKARLAARILAMKNNKKKALLAKQTADEQRTAERAAIDLALDLGSKFPEHPEEVPSAAIPASASASSSSG